MEPRAIYAAIQESAPEGIDQRVLEILKQHRGMDNRISRRELVLHVYGVDLPAGTNLANNRQDRNIREAIERLRTNHPILSSSGNGGYWYAANQEELDGWIREQESRVREMAIRIGVLRAWGKQMRSHFRQMTIEEA